MILVTLGTQSQKFYRLLDAIENLDTDEEIIVQAGGSADYKSEKMKIFDFISYDEMEKYIKEARVIITHGGTGSIIMPLQQKKKIIAAPRLEKYGEHVNDHQKEITEVFKTEGYILEFNDGDDLQEIFKRIEKFKPKKYVSNTESFTKELKMEIDEPVKKRLPLISLSILLFTFFLVLSYFIPLIGDDWTTNVLGVTSIGDAISRAYQLYFEYEGRVVSRVFVLIFSSSKLLWNVLNAIILTGIFILFNKIVKNKRNKFILFLTFTFFIFLDNEVFKQCVVWLTGNLTYTLPTFFALLFLYLNNEIFDNKYDISKLKFVICAILVALTSMMVEQVSAAMVLGTLALLVLSTYRNKRFDLKRCIYFIISSVGFLLMFTSPGANARLGTTDFNTLGLFDKIFINIPNFINYTYLTNFVLIVLMGISIYLIIKNNKIKFGKILNVLIFCLIFVTGLAYVYNFAHNYLTYDIFFLDKFAIFGNFNNVFIIFIWVLFTLLFLYLIFRYIQGNDKIKVLFYTLIGYSANAAMLLSPFWGGRTTFFTIVMLFIACLLIFKYYNFDLFKNKYVKYILITVTICFMSVIMILYYNVYLQTKDRNEMINKQITEGKSTIVYDMIPNYCLHNPNATTEWHQKQFKIYYGIDNEKKLERHDLKYKYNIFYVKEEKQ